MKLKFTLVLIFLTSCLFGQDSKNKVTGIKTGEGNSSIRLNCGASTPPLQPLFIVDGIPLDTAELQTLNTNNILKIEILKDSNPGLISCRKSYSGIVIITTKSSQMREFTIKDQFTSEPVPFAYVTFIPVESERDSIMLATNEEGKVSTHLLKQKKNYKVKISSVGYKSWEGGYFNDTKRSMQFILSRDIVSNAPVIVVGYGITCHRITITCGGVFKKITLADSMDVNGRFNQIKIFPNPVSRGNVINLELNSPDESRMKSQILSLDGKILSSQSLTGYKGLNRISFPIESRWAAGVYFLRVMDENGKPIQQEKFLVQ